MRDVKRVGASPRQTAVLRIFRWLAILPVCVSLAKLHTSLRHLSALALHSQPVPFDFGNQAKEGRRSEVQQHSGADASGRRPGSNG